MTNSAPIPTVTWADRLDMASVAQARQALLDALAATGPEGGACLRIQAAADDDYLARQLVAAARVSAAAKRVTVEAFGPDGAWPATKPEGGAH